MFFDLQRFVTIETIYGPKWVKETYPAFPNTWYFVPEGQSAVIDDENGFIGWSSVELTNVVSVTPDNSLVVTITPVDYNMSKVRATGELAPALHVRDPEFGYYSKVNPNGTLSGADPIAGGAWYPFYRREGWWGYLSANATTFHEGYLDDNFYSHRIDPLLAVVIKNADGVIGTPPNITVFSDQGNTPRDMTFENASFESSYNLHDLKIMYNGEEYCIPPNYTYAFPCQETIYGSQWRPSNGNWVFLPSGASATLNNKTGDLMNTDTTTIQISNVSKVSGSRTAATLTLASGKTVSDVTVTGADAGGLTATVSGQQYYVDSNGKLVSLYSQINGAQWRNATPSGAAKWVYLPSGKSANVNVITGDMGSTSTTVLQITGVSNVTGDAASATATLSGALADVTVTGSAASSVIITVDGTEYYVSGNKLTALYTVINGAQWLENDGSYVFLPAGVSAQISNKTGAMVSTDTTTLQITGVSGVSGNARTATITLAGEISDVTVTGAAVRDVIIKIGVIKYSVNENGKLVQAVLAPPTTQIISIVEKGGAESSQQKLDYLNPKASDEQISTFMNALNSLTVNKTTKTIRVDKRTIL